MQVVGAVLAGLGRFGQRCGVQVAVGVRSLGLAAGVSHDTAAAVLRYLREQPDPFVVLLEPAAGMRGDRYELRIPDRWLRAAYRGGWVGGAVPVPHPVFRARGRLGGGLGLAAGAVYAVLSEVARAGPAGRGGGPGGRGASAAGPTSASTVWPAGGRAGGFGATPTRTGSLTGSGLGEYLAVLRARYRADRAAYHALRRRVADQRRPAETCGPDDVLDVPVGPDPLADEAVDAAVALIRHALGGVVVEDLAA